jgi:hypothetical protein
MFKGSYTDQFYRAIRDALHAEVESWHTPIGESHREREVADLWNVIAAIEPSSPGLNFIPLNSVSATAGK